MNPATAAVPIPIDVPLRGSRSYLHSTNLFDFLVGRTGAKRNFLLTFRSKIECETEALPLLDGDRAERYPARFSGDTDGGRVDYVLREKTPVVPLVARAPYDENAVARGSRIVGEAIFSESQNGASQIERIVALNKRLLSELTGGSKTLVFSQLSLRALPRRDSRLQIELKGRLGNRLFRSAISDETGQVGEIVFYGI